LIRVVANVLFPPDVLQRVATLLRDNRRFRRKALQVQAASAGHGRSAAAQAAAAATSELPTDVGALSDRQQLPMAAEGDSYSPEALLLTGSDAAPLRAAAGSGQAAGVGADAATAKAEVSALSSALSNAEQELQLLSAENEKLMDLSNSLRAENHRLKSVSKA
jgi:hypothetical protein